MESGSSCTPLAENRPKAVLWRAALAGAATGLRSTAAIAALIDGGTPGLPTSRGDQRLGLPRASPSRPSRYRQVALDASRLETRGLATRAAAAGAAAVVLARGANQPVLPNALVAAATALLSARVGHDMRVAAAERFPPLAVAGSRTLPHYASRRRAWLCSGHPPAARTVHLASAPADRHKRLDRQIATSKCDMLESEWNQPVDLSRRELVPWSLTRVPGHRVRRVRKPASTS